MTMERVGIEVSPSTNSRSLLAFTSSGSISSVHAQPVGQAVALFNEWHRRAGRTRSVGDTKFSHDRGFYENPFEVTIATATPGATIVYTTDGSEPSPSNGMIGDKIFVDNTTVLRAMAYKGGATSTNVDTHTYIFPTKVREQATLPFDYPAPFRSFNLAPRPDLDLERTGSPQIGMSDSGRTPLEASGKGRATSISNISFPAHGVRSAMRSFQRFTRCAPRISRKARLCLPSASISTRNSVSGRPGVGVLDTAIENWSTAFGGTRSGKTNFQPSKAARDSPSKLTSREG